MNETESQKMEQENNMESINIDGIKYVPADIQQAETWNNLEYVLVRTRSAGVFVGYLAQKGGKEVMLKKARRLWYWDGAASLSQIAAEGVSKPKNCKFPCEVDSIILTEATEIIDCTETARQSIKKVKTWKE